jgi:hypothetical protein
MSEPVCVEDGCTELADNERQVSDSVVELVCADHTSE